MVFCSMRCQWGGSGGRAVMAAGMSMRLPVCSLVARVVGNEIGLFWILSLLGLPVVVSTGLRLWPSVDPTILEQEHAPLQHEHLHTHDEHHQHEHEGWERPEPHRHPHRHAPLRHRHAYVIDYHYA
jgi:ABC-type Zn2+ transport system substrate-binding protein/surface adhesin